MSKKTETKKTETKKLNKLAVKKETINDLDVQNPEQVKGGKSVIYSCRICDAMTATKVNNG
jgi:hypothetical protein